MTKFDFSGFNFFGNSSNTSKKRADKQRRGRQCRIEELEGREMLSATPWTLISEYEVGCPPPGGNVGDSQLETASAEYRTQPLGDRLPTSENALAQLAAVDAKYTEVKGLKQVKGVKNSAMTLSTITLQFNAVSLAAETDTIKIELTSGKKATLKTYNLVFAKDVDAVNGWKVENDGGLKIDEAKLFKLHDIGSQDPGKAAGKVLKAPLYTLEIGGLEASTKYAVKSFQSFKDSGNTQTKKAVKTSASTLKYAAVKKLKATVAGESVNLTWTAHPNTATTGYEIWMLTKVKKETKEVLLDTVYDKASASVSIATLKANALTGFIKTGKDWKPTLEVRAKGAGPDDTVVKSLFAKKAVKVKKDVLSTALDSPTNFSATISGTAAALAWNVVAGATGYEIRYRAVGEAVTVATWDVPKVIGEGTVKTDDLSGLAADKMYLFEIKAVKDTAESVWVGVYAKTKTADVVLVAPSDLNSTGKTSVSVSLSWTAPDTEDVVLGYEVQYTTGSEAWKTWDENTVITKTNVTVGGLEAETAYQFQVRAVYAEGTSAWTSAITETTLAAVAELDTPENVQAARKVGAETSTVSVSWDPVENNNGYTVQYSMSSTFASGNLTKDAAQNADSLDIDGLTPGTTYYFRVLAKGYGTTVADSDYSASQTVTLSQPLTPPATLEYGVPKQTSGEATWEVNLFWVAVADTNATGYEICYLMTHDADGKAVSDSTWSNPISVAGRATTTHLITGLTANATYLFEIVVVSTNELYAPSPAIVTDGMKVEKPTTMPVVQNLAVKTKSQSAISLTWDAHALTAEYGVTKDDFIIQYKTGGGAWADVGAPDVGGICIQGTSHVSEGIVNPSTGYSASHANIIGLDADTTYEFQIKVKAAGVYLESPDWSDSTGPIKTNEGLDYNRADHNIGSVDHFVVRSVNGTSVTLEWWMRNHYTNPVVGVQIQYSQTGSGVWTTWTGSIFEVSFDDMIVSETITGLEAGLSYDFRIRMVTEHGNGDNYDRYYPWGGVRTVNLSTDQQLTNPQATFANDSKTKDTDGTWSVKLEWNAEARTQNYVIEWIQSKTAPTAAMWTALAAGANTANRITVGKVDNAVISGLADGGTYWFRIRAVTADTNVKDSDWWVIGYPAVMQDRVMGETIENIRTVSTSENGVLLLWDAIPGMLEPYKMNQAEAGNYNTLGAGNNLYRDLYDVQYQDAFGNWITLTLGFYSNWPRTGTDSQDGNGAELTSTNSLVILDFNYSSGINGGTGRLLNDGCVEIRMRLKDTVNHEGGDWVYHTIEQRELLLGQIGIASAPTDTEFSVILENLPAANLLKETYFKANFEAALARAKTPAYEVMLNGAVISANVTYTDATGELKVSGLLPGYIAGGNIVVTLVDKSDNTALVRLLVTTGGVVAFNVNPNMLPTATPSSVRVKSSETTPTSITLEWAPPAENWNVAGYWIQYQEVGGAWLIAFAEGVDTTSLTITGLSSSTTYNFQIRALSKYGNNVFHMGPATGSLTVETALADGALPQPRVFARGNVDKTPSATTWQADLSWSAVAGADGYEIRYQMTHTAAGAAVPSPTWSVAIPIAGRTTTKHTVTGLTAGATYAFEIVVIPANTTTHQKSAPKIVEGVRMESAFTAIVTTEMTGSVPLVNLDREWPGDNWQAELNWDVVAEAVGYQIRYQEVVNNVGEEQPTSAWTWLSNSNTSPISGNTATVTGLRQMGTYVFEIVAIMDSSDRTKDAAPKLSNRVRMEKSAAEKVANPSDFIDFRVQNVGSDRILLVWELPAGGRNITQSYGNDNNTRPNPGMQFEFSVDGGITWNHLTWGAGNGGPRIPTGQSMSGYIGFGQNHTLVFQLAPGTEYMFRGMLKETANYLASDWHYSEVITTLPGAAPSVASLAAAITLEAGTTTTLTWNTPARSLGVQYYEVRYIVSSASTADKADDSKWTNYGGTDFTSVYGNSLDITGLAAGTYDFQIRAVAAWAPGGTGTVIVPTPGGYNYGGVPSVNEVTGNWKTATLTVAAMTGSHTAAATVGADGNVVTVTVGGTLAAGTATIAYDVEVLQGSTVVPNTSYAVTQAGQVFTISDLAAGSYTFRVIATAPGYVSQSVTTTPATTITAPAIPGVVTGIKTGSVTNSTVSISWTPATTGTLATNFVVEYREKGATPWQSVKVYDTNARITGLEADTEYEFQVKAGNAGGLAAPVTLAPNVTTAKDLLTMDDSLFKGTFDMWQTDFGPPFGTSTSINSGTGTLRPDEGGQWPTSNDAKQGGNLNWGDVKVHADDQTHVTYSVYWIRVYDSYRDETPAYLNADGSLALGTNAYGSRNGDMSNYHNDGLDKFTLSPREGQWERLPSAPGGTQPGRLADNATDPIVSGMAIGNLTPIGGEITHTDKNAIFYFLVVAECEGYETSYTVIKHDMVLPKLKTSADTNFMLNANKSVTAGTTTVTWDTDAVASTPVYYRVFYNLAAVPPSTLSQRSFVNNDSLNFKSNPNVSSWDNGWCAIVMQDEYDAITDSAIKDACIVGVYENGKLTIPASAGLPADAHLVVVAEANGFQRVSQVLQGR